MTTVAKVWKKLNEALLFTWINFNHIMDKSLYAE